jgi:hypothetical protein
MTPQGSSVYLFLLPLITECHKTLQKTKDPSASEFTERMAAFELKIAEVESVPFGIRAFFMQRESAKVLCNAPNIY